MISGGLRRKRKGAIKYLPFGMRLDDLASSFDRSIPKPVHEVLNKVVVPNRIRESSVGAFLILGPSMNQLAVKRSVRERLLSNGHATRNIGRSRVSQVYW